LHMTSLNFSGSRGKGRIFVENFTCIIYTKLK
jgi:hypothetical protein